MRLDKDVISVSEVMRGIPEGCTDNCHGVNIA